MTEQRPTHDPLTGLPNRALFMERLVYALSQTHTPAGIAVLFLDIDDFKSINDTLGYEKANRVLATVGERLAGAVGPHTLLARFGGDEFLALIEQITGPDDVIREASRAAAAANSYVEVDGRTVAVSISIGAAITDTTRPRRPEDLVREADIALYQAKTLGGGQIVLFDAGAAVTTRRSPTLEDELRHAIDTNELCLYYQPEVDLRTGATVGVEALLRWPHPRRGMIPPDTFVPIAEESGLIVPIGRWALEAACRQARAWRDLVPAAPTLVMSVNLSARQFQQPDLVDQVAHVLRESGLPPGALRLEITERTVMEDGETTRALLYAFKDLGVGLALDDFGTGYSSLSYLRRFPVDSLKIDREFIHDLSRDESTLTIVRAITALGHALGLAVTVEGIETAEDLAHVLPAGCDRGQGYYFSRPLPGNELVHILRARLPRAR